VLSALDAVQEEMLGRPLQRESGGSNTVQFRKSPRRGPTRRRGREGDDGPKVKIEPLFENLEQGSEPAPAEGADEEPDEEAEPVETPEGAGETNQ
jgi:hypothetical protein